MDGLSDAVLVARMAAGDERALGSLYDRHGRLAYSLALAMTRCEEDAEQVVADAFCELWRRAKTTRERGEEVGGTLASVVRRRALELQRRGRTLRTRMSERPVARPLVLDGKGEGNEAGRASSSTSTESARDAVIDVLRGLPDLQRIVLEMAYFRGLPVGEIAREIHESEREVGALLRSAMDALRRSTATVASPPHEAVTRQ